MLALAGQVPAEEIASWMAQVKGPQGIEANLEWGGAQGRAGVRRPQFSRDPGRRELASRRRAGMSPGCKAGSGEVPGALDVLCFLGLGPWLPLPGSWGDQLAWLWVGSFGQEWSRGGKGEQWSE